MYMSTYYVVHKQVGEIVLGNGVVHICKIGCQMAHLPYPGLADYRWAWWVPRC